jgi:hypothetical protein
LREQVNFQRDDDEVRFVLGQRAELDFYRASSLKQQSEVDMLLRSRIGGIMVSVFTCSVVDRGFEPRSGQRQEYKISICCFSAKHAALRRKSKDWSLLICIYKNTTQNRSCSR